MADLKTSPIDIEANLFIAPDAEALHADEPSAVVPPTRKSVTSSGSLKDTPANRALAPVVATDAQFKSENLRSKAVYADDHSLVFQGDSRAMLSHIQAAGLKVDCIVTSPPFYGQRDYGMKG